MSEQKFRGVSKSGNKFAAHFQHQGERTFLGSFPTEEEAARAYDAAARKALGKRAPVNFEEEEGAEEALPVAVDKIDLAAGTQSRAEVVYPDTVADYVEQLRMHKRLPPVVLFTTDRLTYYVGDGFQRIAAHKAEGIARIPAVVLEGGVNEAKEYSSGSNHAHGRPRSHADKRAAVKLLLTVPGWDRKSDRALAEQCHVSHDLVADVRKELEAQSGDNATRREEKREAKDGSKRPARKTTADNGEVKFDWSAFHLAWGGLYRQIDKLGNAYFCKETPAAEGLRRQLAEFRKGMKQWYKDVSKLTPPED